MLSWREESRCCRHSSTKPTAQWSLIMWISKCPICGKCLHLWWSKNCHYFCTALTELFSLGTCLDTEWLLQTTDRIGWGRWVVLERGYSTRISEYLTIVAPYMSAKWLNCQAPCCYQALVSLFPAGRKSAFGFLTSYNESHVNAYLPFSVAWLWMSP